MTTDPRLLLLQEPLLKHSFPLKVGMTEFTRVSLKCKRCQQELSADKVHGVEVPVSNKDAYREFNAIGACPACKVLTCAQFRLHKDKTISFLSAENTWTSKQAT